jgi:hypothetical protein
MHEWFRFMVCRIALIVFIAAFMIPMTLYSQDYPGTESGDEPSYPGIPPTGGKLEGTLGSFNLRLYGTILLNVSGSDSSIVGTDVPLWATPSSVRTQFPDGTQKRVDDVHELIFTARQTTFGFLVKPATTSGGWNTSGKVEMDFFGTRPVDNNLPQGRVFNQPRLRFAYFQFGKNNWKITAGQDKAILAPLDPVSLSHVAIPLGSTAGNLWAWLPQVRLDSTHNFGESALSLQAGVLRPQFADPRLGDLPTSGTSLEGSPGLGERASQPFYQGRVALSTPLGGSKLSVGASGHYGRERVGAARTVDSSAVAIDFAVPAVSRLIWRGELFTGSNLVPFQGGILQGVATPLTGNPIPFTGIDSRGGWTELIIKATSDNKNVFYVGVSEDDPRDSDLTTGSTRSRNAMAWASYFRKLNDQITIALEWSNWQFKTRQIVGGAAGPQGPSGTANVFNLAFAYQF